MPFSSGLYLVIQDVFRIVQDIIPGSNSLGSKAPWGGRQVLLFESILKGFGIIILEFIPKVVSKM